MQFANVTLVAFAAISVNARLMIRDTNTTTSNATTTSAIASIYEATTSTNNAVAFAYMNSTSTSSATTSTNQISTPTNTPTNMTDTSFGGDAGVAGFVYLGCFADTSGFLGFTLKLSGLSNSVDTCTQVCSASTFQYAGLVGSRCYCRMVLAPNLSREPDSFCSTACPDDPSQACGGSLNGQTPSKNKRQVPSGFLLSLYQSVALAAAPSVASVPVNTVVVVTNTAIGNFTTMNRAYQTQIINTTYQTQIANTYVTSTVTPKGAACNASPSSNGAGSNGAACNASPSSNGATSNGVTFCNGAASNSATCNGSLSFSNGTASNGATSCNSSGSKGAACNGSSSSNSGASNGVTSCNGSGSQGAACSGSGSSNGGVSSNGGASSNDTASSNGAAVSNGVAASDNNGATSSGFAIANDAAPKSVVQLGVSAAGSVVFAVVALAF